MSDVLSPGWFAASTSSDCMGEMNQGPGSWNEQVPSRLSVWTSVGAEEMDTPNNLVFWDFGRAIPMDTRNPWCW